MDPARHQGPLNGDKSENNNHAEQVVEPLPFPDNPKPGLRHGQVPAKPIDQYRDHQRKGNQHHQGDEDRTDSSGQQISGDIPLPATGRTLPGGHCDTALNGSRASNGSNASTGSNASGSAGRPTALPGPPAQ